MNPWVGALEHFNVFNLIDILVVAFVLYRVLLLIRDTRAVQLLKGIFVILIATAVSSLLHLQLLNGLLHQIITVGVFAIVVIFQPELRRALEQIGRGGFFSLGVWTTTGEDLEKSITEVVKAAQVLAKPKIGALIVIERETKLSEYIETGTLIEGLVSSELLINTFIPNTPLHDGAVIIRGNKVISAGCFLPLTDNRNMDKKLGTRHRAAVGITEHSDCVAVVVSEETGKVSLAVDGVLTVGLEERALYELLQTLLVPKRGGRLHFLNRKAES